MQQVDNKKENALLKLNTVTMNKLSNKSSSCNTQSLKSHPSDSAQTNSFIQDQKVLFLIEFINIIRRISSGILVMDQRISINTFKLRPTCILPVWGLSLIIFKFILKYSSVVLVPLMFIILLIQIFLFISHKHFSSIEAIIFSWAPPRIASINFDNTKFGIKAKIKEIKMS